MTLLRERTALLRDELALLGEEVGRLMGWEVGLLGHELLVGWDRESLRRRIKCLRGRELLTVMRGWWVRIHTLGHSSV